ncbi:conserved hypothetical protein [Nostocoides australiense Ben110]|uniref:DUF917 domain-containing protein n=1 Tax=Nostocoides australiense Ben110 TaxID=1193182 RepID=W6K0H9_9MICO|nr:DUF917 domain-containing protein [Tetrasphaera australiensis]CCH74505.1 conserved hypothetical protein [Tetrasphaera australiensis Ben110]
MTAATEAGLSTLGEQEVEDLAVGCTVLAGGGGGDPRVGLMMTLSAVRELGPADVIRLDDLAEDDYLFAAGMIGAPTVMMEKIPSGREGAVIKETIEANSGRKVAAMMPLEMGGINGLLPIAWAIRARLPLIDGDLMGRAFPEIQMCTPHLYDMPAWPCVLVDERSQAITFEPVGNVWLERLARNAVSVLGGCACSGLYPMTVARARQPVIAGTVSNAVRVGRALREARNDPFAALAGVLDTYPLMTGKVVEVERRTAGGFVRGGAVIEGTDQDAGRLVRIEFQNENLVAIEDGEALATVPDIITLLDRHTARGIVTEHIRYGQRVVVTVFPAPEQWRTPRGLEVVGPRAFGYDIDFVPVEEQHAQAR